MTDENLRKFESMTNDSWYALDDREKADSLVRCVAAIWVTLDGDDAGMIVGSTISADRIFGYAEGMLIGERLNKLIPERFRAKHDEHFRRFAEAPEPRAMGGVDAQLAGVGRDGVEFSVEIGLHPQFVRRRRIAVALIAPARNRNG